MEFFRPICSEKTKWIEELLHSSANKRKDLKSISLFINEDDTKIKNRTLQSES